MAVEGFVVGSLAIFGIGCCGDGVEFATIVVAEPVERNLE